MTDPFTIYDKHPHMDAYRVYGFFEPYAINAVNKRFTDAELAAEYWRVSPVQYREYVQPDGSSVYLAERDIINQFCTLSHYDE